MEHVKQFLICKVYDETRIVDMSNMPFAIIRQTSDGNYRIYSANTSRILFTHNFASAEDALAYFEKHYASLLPWLLVV